MIIYMFDQTWEFLHSVVFWTFWKHLGQLAPKFWQNWTEIWFRLVSQVVCVGLGYWKLFDAVIFKSLEFIIKCVSTWKPLDSNTQTWHCQYVNSLPSLHLSIRILKILTQKQNMLILTECARAWNNALWGTMSFLWYLQYNLIPRAKLSLKVLAELPIIVVLMYQLYKQNVHQDVAEFIPLIMNTIVLQPSKDQRWVWLSLFYVRVSPHVRLTIKWLLVCGTCSPATNLLKQCLKLLSENFDCWSPLLLSGKLMLAYTFNSAHKLW